MVVDDTRENLRLLVSILSAQGYQVRPATNGPQALTAAQSSPPDLILLDIMMPEMDGYAVCAALKADARTRDIPIIFISALHDVIDKIRAFEVGGVDYVTKPFQAEEVLARVNTHLTLQHTQEALRRSEARYRAIVEDQTELVCRLRPDTILTFVNAAYCRYFGKTSDELVGQSFLYSLPPEEHSTVCNHLAALGRSTPVLSLEHRVVNAQGQIRWVQWTNRAIADNQGQLLEIQIVGRDITERVESEASVRNLNTQLTRAVTEQETLNRLSRMIQRCQTTDEAYGVSIPFLRELFANQSGVLYQQESWRQETSPQQESETHRLEQVGRWGDATIEPTLLVEDCPVLAGGRVNLFEDYNPTSRCAQCLGKGKLPAICVQLRDGSEQFGLLHVRGGPDDSELSLDRWSRLAIMTADLLSLALSNLRLRADLREQAIRDPLTGLFNRRFLDEMLVKQLSQSMRYERPLGILLLDIDHFKQLNDSYGHHAGDAVLHTIASFLRTALRAGDTACRFGGEEFLLVLPEIELPAAVIRADDLRSEIHTLYLEYEGKVLPAVTVSIGVASFPDHGTTPDALLIAADRALYLAKAAGRNRVHVYTPPSI